MVGIGQSDGPDFSRLSISTYFSICLSLSPLIYKKISKLKQYNLEILYPMGFPEKSNSSHN